MRLVSLLTGKRVEIEGRCLRFRRVAQIAIFEIRKKLRLIEGQRDFTRKAK